MTSFDIERLPFTRKDLRSWQADDRRFINWPVVYILDDGKRAYVGETLNTAARMRQHLESAERKTLKSVRLVLDDTFNKSVCLDLESQLISLLAADEKFTVLNSNKGIVDADYFDRPRYRDTFRQIFDALREQHVFTRSLPEIENRELFKLSPFKALNRDQAIAMEDILEGLFDDWNAEAATPITVQGDPGTGKTIVAVYLLKLLRDLAQGKGLDDLESDALFSDFFTEDNHRLLDGSRLGLVVPQQALRASLKRVFAKTPGLDKTMVLTPFDVGKSDEPWDLLVVDESHRLNHRANQASGMQNKSFGEINEKLFGTDADHLTQVDWIRKQSRHQIFLIDSHQSVRPADLPQATQKALIDESEAADRRYRLFTQMRVQGGADYVSFARALLGDKPREREDFGTYDVRFFDDLGEMHDAIRARDAQVGLSRLVAGYAWEWRSKNDSAAIDIEIDGRKLQWNQTQTDWITSPGAVEQVGSIHTVQGYDLNYAGVVIGPDVRFEQETQRVVFNRSNYFDKKGMENNPRLGIEYSDEDVLRFVTNVYSVLMTRGVLGTYLYVVDPALREHLRAIIQAR
ncbi:DNA/RNA helicase domain-containing protein [Curtobacterium sp. 8I-2]|uniref:DNA/RNA helicase domain-containing protein n=1 Tax=Curtobacterium sp. 8I-2 TaxID=2653136 RepID=UPI0012EF0071|nr:DNA/RNA helicase domain-containing protein [Curtobacterium sp. 8I-2]VXA97830.1 AAA family ATPase [Curtobacterium sp. 8I-2]